MEHLPQSQKQGQEIAGPKDPTISGSLDKLSTTYKKLEIKGFPDVLRPGSGSLSLRKIVATGGELGKKNVILFIASDVIAELAEFLNVGKNMNSSQCLATAELILLKMPHLHMEDLKLCMQNGKAGDYGKTYDRLDGQVIFDWLDKYQVQKMEFIDNQHQQVKHGTDLVEPSNERFIGILKEVTEKKEKTTPEKPRDISAEQKLANEWMRDFDKLHSEQFQGTGGTRFVKINEKMYSLAEYLEYRLAEFNEKESAA